MSLESILLIGILTMLAIAFGADCLWSLAIGPYLLNTSDLSKEAEPDRFLDIAVNVQRQTNQFLLVIFLVISIGAIALNVIPHSRLEPYLIKISLLSLIFVFSLILVEFGQINLNISIKPIVATIFIGTRLITELVAYWAILHYALNPKI